MKLIQVHTGTRRYLIHIIPCDTKLDASSLCIFYFRGILLANRFEDNQSDFLE
jgi:hypothetical protein